MKSIPMSDLREDLTNMVEYVKKSDQPLIITRFGKALAILTPYKSRKEEVMQKQWRVGNVSTKDLVEQRPSNKGETR